MISFDYYVKATLYAMRYHQSIFHLNKGILDRGVLRQPAGSREPVHGTREQQEGLHQRRQARVLCGRHEQLYRKLTVQTDYMFTSFYRFESIV